MLQFIQLNAQQKDQFGNPMINPMTGQPIMQNLVGELDVGRHHGRREQDTKTPSRTFTKTLSQIMPNGITPMPKPAEASLAIVHPDRFFVAVGISEKDKGEF